MWREKGQWKEENGRSLKAAIENPEKNSIIANMARLSHKAKYVKHW